MDYAYDANSNLISVTITAGTASISNGLTYNQLDQLVALSRNGVNQAKLIYDERGKIISVSYANGTYSALEYDDANRLKSIKNYNNAGALLDSYNYTYDANSNITSAGTSAGTISYQYDNLNQLTKETMLDGTTISYTYDKVGNRTSKAVTKDTTTTTNYTYDAANQLTAVNGQAYAYDANGNLTGNGAKTFIYDVENRLIEVKNSSGVSLATFTYDHEGKRTSMASGNDTIYFHYNGDKVIYETDANNKIIAEYTWDEKGHPVSMTKSGLTYYYHLNGHGDVTSLTDTNGNIVAEYRYDAWGNIISQTGSMATSNPYRYASYRFDDSTGLYYLMSRYYDSQDGRFLTRDTLHGYADDPLSINQYTYTKNNPVIYVDPDGHFAQIIYALLRFLVTTVGLYVAKKAIAIATPYVKKALREPENYILEGRGGGGRLIQVRYKKTGSVLFRLDWYPIKAGGPYTLHYHVPPNVNEHVVLYTR
jgi:RHS repeat-associated protein